MPYLEVIAGQSSAMYIIRQRIYKRRVLRSNILFSSQKLRGEVRGQRGHLVQHRHPISAAESAAGRASGLRLRCPARQVALGRLDEPRHPLREPHTAQGRPCLLRQRLEVRIYYLAVIIRSSVFGTSGCF